MSEAVEIEREAVPRPPNHYTEPEFVTVEGVPTAYRRKGTGEPVLFLHGAGSDDDEVVRHRIGVFKNDFQAR